MSADAEWGPAHSPAVDALLVRVTTDQGVRRRGEAFWLPANAVAQRAIDDLITPLCLGQDASRIGALMRDETELPAIRAARSEAGPGAEIMVDVNCAWSLGQARELAEDRRDPALKWLEEPVWPPENYDDLAELHRTEGMAIAAGENAGTLMEFHRLLASGAVDFVQPSPTKTGGVTELRKVFPIAAAHNATVMPHSFYDGPGLLAALHVLSALGAGDSMIAWRYFDLQAQILGEAVNPEHGRIHVPQGPGLGIDPDPGVIRAYRTA